MDVIDLEVMSDLRKYIGLADACELMAATFDFPTQELAQALVDGDYKSDCMGCLADIGVDPDVAGKIETELTDFEARNADELFDTLKKGNSILYLAPGLQVPVWPFESPFFTTRQDPTAKPSLFRTQIALDVEKLMRDAGIQYEHARTQPIDSIWEEFTYLSYLYGNLSQFIFENNAEQAAEWRGHIKAFTEKHVNNWFEDFMAKSIEYAPQHSYGKEYATFARIGEVITRELIADNA